MREEAMPLDDDRHDEQSDALEKIDKVIALLAIEDKWCKFFAETSDRRRCLGACRKGCNFDNPDRIPDRQRSDQSRSCCQP